MSDALKQAMFNYAQRYIRERMHSLIGTSNLATLARSSIESILKDMLLDSRSLVPGDGRDFSVEMDPLRPHVVVITPLSARAHSLCRSRLSDRKNTIVVTLEVTEQKE